MITFIEKSYPGQIARPQTKIITSQTDNVVCALTSWGDPLPIDELIKEPIDSDNTQPAIKQMHPLIQKIERINLKVLETINKKNYVSGFEILLLQVSHQKLTWVQIGQPSLFILREKQVISLSPSYDLSVEYNQKHPLPSALIGLHKNISLKALDFKLLPNDQIILYYGRPFNLNLMSQNQFDLNQIFNLIIKDDSQQSFWIAHSNLD